MFKGHTFTRHGQEYECAGFKPYTCHSGREIELIKLASECVVCGERYRTTATRSAVRGSRRWNVTRTCKAHRGLGPRWRSPLLIDAAAAALAERPATFLTARELAEATGRSASGMGNALRRAPHGRLVRRVGPYQTALYLLIPRGERHAARVGREALAEWRRGVLEARGTACAEKLAKMAADAARRQARKPPVIDLEALGPVTRCVVPAGGARVRRRTGVGAARGRRLAFGLPVSRRGSLRLQH